MQEILVVTSWFDPATHAESAPLTVRFSGHRLDVKGRYLPGDRFVQDETIEKVIAGSGPISLTTRVRGINPGSWVVTTRSLEAAHPAQKHKYVPPMVEPDGPIIRFWRRWAPSAESAEAVKTCLAPFAHVPGIIPGMWAVMVTLGVALALTLQFLLISVNHLKVGPWWVVSSGAIMVGIIGAKLQYLVLYRSLRGWCIQGFITAATVMAAILLVVLHVPARVFLDVTAPGLLTAMAVGRVGCFFAGCCGGPPTASRFGVWSSDQRVGARRIPTQLLESLLAGMLGLLVLAAFLRHGLAGGAYFAIGLAANTLGRQGILQLRAESRKTRLGGRITAALAALVLAITLIFLF
jgi:phosphatidylglycerol:prolipoprotein diacylglycerol transferase